MKDSENYLPRGQGGFGVAFAEKTSTLLRREGGFGILAELRRKGVLSILQDTCPVLRREAGQDNGTKA